MIDIINKMQSETADFPPPGAATWRTRRNIHAVFDSGPFSPCIYMKTWRCPKNRCHITDCIAVWGRPSHGHR